MNLQDSTRNVFQLHVAVRKLPFAISRANWADQDLIVVTKVVPKGKYGTAFGFPVRDGIPNDHGLSKSMEISCAGCYQWRVIDVPDFRLMELIEEFYNTVGKSYGIYPPKEDSEHSPTDRNDNQ